MNTNTLLVLMTIKHQLTIQKVFFNTLKKANPNDKGKEKLSKLFKIYLKNAKKLLNMYLESHLKLLTCVLENIIKSVNQ